MTTWIKETHIVVSGGILAIACFAYVVLAQAQQPAADAAIITATAPGKGAAERVVQITASLEAVDAASRAVTLKGPSGDIVTLAVGPEVKNFGKIRVGDFVVVRYIDSLTLELKKGGTAVRERTDLDVTGRARPSERPAVSGAHQVHVVADVIAIDAPTQTVTLRGPTRVVQLQVQDPQQFDLVAVGDQVEATYTEAVVISVEPARNLQ
jgi:hypothetical protein